MSIFSKKIYIDYHYIEHPYQISHLQSFVLSLFLECPAHYNYSLSMHCHNFSNIQVLLSSKSPQVSLPSFLCFNNCCEDGPYDVLPRNRRTQSPSESLAENKQTGRGRWSTREQVAPRWSWPIFATIPQVNISQYLQVSIFADWQY